MKKARDVLMDIVKQQDEPNSKKKNVFAGFLSSKKVESKEENKEEAKASQLPKFVDTIVPTTRRGEIKALLDKTPIS